MSTDESIDPRMVEQAQQQIRALVDEIAGLSRRDISADEFFPEYLQRVVAALAAVGGVTWKVGSGGGLELQAQMNFRESQLADQDEIVSHRKLIHRCFTSGEPAIVPPRTGGPEEHGFNPTEFLLVIAPVKIGDEVHQVVEVFQRPNPQPKTQKGYLRFLTQMCELASQFVKNRQLQKFTDRQSLWSQLEQFTRYAHTSLVPREAAYTIANEGRRLIQCDRVSVAIRKGKVCHVIAISGQDTFDKRSNTVVLLGELASAVVSAGEPLWFTGETADLAPQIEDAVQAYVDDSHTKQIAVIPLRKPDPPGKEKLPDDLPVLPLGALIIEQIEDTRPREGFMQRVNVVCEHSCTAMANAIEHDELFLMPVWRAIGKSRVIMEARHLPKTISAAIVAFVLLIVMIFVPYNFNLHSVGTLQPVTRYEVFAEVDGIIQSIECKHGQEVKKGQPLIKLQNAELSTRLAEKTGEMNVTNAKIGTTTKALSDKNRKLSTEEKVRLEGELHTLREQLVSLQNQISLYQTKLQKLTIVAPSDGVITTWDVEKLLRNRPVKTGQAVLNVADGSGEWEVELKMSEDRMGYMAKAQAEIKHDLEVTYHSATDSSITYHGHVTNVHWSAEIRGEEGNTVLVKVAIDKNEFKDNLKQLRPGADVAAKVHCGRQPIYFCLFHDLIAWIRKKILFKVF